MQSHYQIIKETMEETAAALLLQLSLKFSIIELPDGWSWVFSVEPLAPEDGPEYPDGPSSITIKAIFIQKKAPSLRSPFLIWKSIMEAGARLLLKAPATIL